MSLEIETSSAAAECSEQLPKLTGRPLEARPRPQGTPLQKTDHEEGAGASKNPGRDTCVTISFPTRGGGCGREWTAFIVPVQREQWQLP